MREWANAHFPERMGKYTLSLKGETILRIFSPDTKSFFEYKFSSAYDRNLVAYELAYRGIDLAPSVRWFGWSLGINLSSIRKYQLELDLAGLAGKEGA